VSAPASAGGGDREHDRGPGAGTGPVAIHQFIPALNPHDATGAHTLRTRAVLREAGWRSEIFAEAIHDDLAGEAYKYWTYREHAAPGDVAMYQFTTSSSVAGFLVEQDLPLILDFHNFTGPDLFAGWEPQSVARAARAAEELDLLAPRALLGLAKSGFSEQTLRAAGCARTAVVPVLADYGRITAEPDFRVLDELEELGAEGGIDILFVGRVVPSKAQHDLVKALWAYRRLYDAHARLHLVGGTSSYEYNKSLQDFVDDLGMARAVRIAGEVSDASLAAYFAVADVFLSLSVHEGFGVPLVEAMSAGIPVVTLDAGAVSETAGNAALVLESVDPSYVAAALHRVSTDDLLRHQLIEAGLARADFLGGDGVARQLVEAITAVLGRP
jgi:glycosyltransferase involved in cell wall biosynthesis